ncbi:uncharacterized protein [Diadema antillarum]|uniref:uncharacterized protein n=1 Tax=Diadema antillarum TaxID=105358 RepID=UPI003A87AAE4
MASQVTAAQREEYRKAFDKADKDSSGKIDAKEFRQLVEVLGKKYNPNLLPEFSDVDADANKKIDFEEFVVMMEKLRPAKLSESQKQDFINAFKLFDKDGNGFITVAEIGEALKSVGDNASEAELKEMVKEVDKDGDGKINYEEFVRLMM